MDSSSLNSDWRAVARAPISVVLRTPESGQMRGQDETLRKLAGYPGFNPHLKSRLLSPPLDASSGRIEQWWLSRRCLLDALLALPGSAQESSLLVSLSHTSGASIAVVAPAPSGKPGDEGPVGIGVDLEASDRRISRSAEERFLFLTERDLGASPLQAWVAKEACFKATPDNLGFLVSDYRFVRLDPSGRGSALCGKAQHLRFELDVRTLGNLVIGLACAFRRP